MADDVGFVFRARPPVVLIAQRQHQGTLAIPRSQVARELGHERIAADPEIGNAVDYGPVPAVGIAQEIRTVGVENRPGRRG